MDKIYLFFFILCIQPCFGQGKVCGKIDTTNTKCYIKQEYPPTDFAIEKKWESEVDILQSQTALLADLDGDCIPELLFGGNYGNEIYIINTISGKTIKKINLPFFAVNSPLPFAIADVDNDGTIEMVIAVDMFWPTPINLLGKLVCLNLDGSVKWISDQRYDIGQMFQRGGTPAFADFNQDGIPEVYIHNSIFNAQTGFKLTDGGNNGIGRQFNSSSYTGSISVAGQIDEDSTDLELAAGYTVYKVSITNPNGIAGNSMIAHNMILDSEFRDGFTSIADINNDGRLDVIVASAGLIDTKLYCYMFNNGISNLIGKVTLNDTFTRIGPPLIGDINSTGQLSIITTRPNKLISFKYNGSLSLIQEWNINAQDISGFTGLTLFDLNNDGKKEIIYRDEGFLRIINVENKIPVELSKIFCPVTSLQEGPIVGDLDNSGNSKICVSCALTSSGNLGKLTVFAPPDSLPGWAPARGIWNQYNYHVLNINDDLTVPRVQKNNATYMNGKYNNFFVQESLLDSNGMYLKKAASLTGKIKCINYDPNLNEYSVIFEIYNRIDASFNADSSLPVSFYNGDPANGGILIGTYNTLQKLENGDSLLNLEFKFLTTNLTDLFMVVNTSRTGTGSFDPKDFAVLECDYTDNTFHTIKLPKIEKLNASICKGASYNFYTAIIKDAGMYHHKLSASNGCDSLISILELTLVDTVQTTQTKIACDAYSWHGQSYIQSGNYLFDTISQFGCDSIVLLELTINKSDSNSIQQTACDTFTWNGITYKQSGSYTYQTINQFACDSILQLELVINKSDAISLSQNTCEPFTWNGQTYTQSGIYSFDTLNRFGCDSLVILDLTINSIITTTITEEVCDSITWNGKSYNKSGIFTFKSQNHLGCDSITTLQLKVNHSNESDTSIIACDQYNWNGKTFDQSGRYSNKTQNTSGCDSLSNLTLKINKSSNSFENQISCNKYNWNGNTYTQSGNYTFQALNAVGCDSIANLNLIVNQSDSLKIQHTACDRYNWNQNTYTKSGNYQYKTLNIKGCDSIINLELTLNKSTQIDLNLSVCDSILFLGQIIKQQGQHAFNIKDTHGCDSTINLNLSILSETVKNKAISCDTFIWNINGQTYKRSGIYSEKYINRFGCDSIQILDLELNLSYHQQQLVEACEEYNWQATKERLTQSGDYTHALKTVHGCDSVLNLHLKLHDRYEQADTVITNKSYTWQVNQQTYEKSGQYKEEFISEYGCDSIFHLVLILKDDIGIYAPNIINPNGINKGFTLFDNGSSIGTIKTLKIFDRWGNLLWQKEGFTANDIQQGWDGRVKNQLVLPGVYIWYTELQLKNGHELSLHGDVTVVR